METEIEERTEEISFEFMTKTEEEKKVFSPEKTLVVLMRSKLGLPSDFEIAGKSLLDWVMLSTLPCVHTVMDEVEEEEILKTIRPLCEGYDTVVVLYSDTPLLKKSTFSEIMERFGGRNSMKLPRGWVFKGEFVRGAYMLLSTAVEQFDCEDFKIVDDSLSAAFAYKVLQKRIISYHMQNGVFFFGENTISVDADVEIEEGTIIYPNNVLKGQTYVGKNVILQSGNFLLDTIVCDEATVCGSYLENSKVEKGKSVGPFVKLVGQVF